VSSQKFKQSVVVVVDTLVRPVNLAPVPAQLYAHGRIGGASGEERRRDH
jgi:hypothetical protein